MTSSLDCRLAELLHAIVDKGAMPLFSVRSECGAFYVRLVVWTPDLIMETGHSADEVLYVHLRSPNELRERAKKVPGLCRAAEEALIAAGRVIEHALPADVVDGGQHSC